MLTEEERNSIINEAVEKALLKIPEVVGNLITSATYSARLNREFYEKYPEFTKDKEMVAKVVQKVEGDNPGKEYEWILEQAVPMIRQHLKTVKGVNMTPGKVPNRNLSYLNSSNGNI